MKKCTAVLLGIAIIALFFAVEPALANTPLDNICSKIQTSFKTAIMGWESYIQGRAHWLFWTLAVINIAWAGGMLALKNADFMGFAAELMKQVMFIGFFYMMLLNGSVWMNGIIDGFIQMGANAGGGYVLPSDVIESCWDVYVAMVGQSSGWKMVTQFGPAVLIAICSILMLAVASWIASIMLCAIIESYFAVAVGQFFLGFGGSLWSKEFAVAYIKYIISLGFKLMVINLGGNLTVTLFKAWATIPSGGMGVEEIGALIVGCFILSMIMTMLPNMANSMISGGQLSSYPIGSGIRSAAMIGTGLAMGGGNLAKNIASGTVKTGGVAYQAHNAPGNTAANIVMAVAQTAMQNFSSPKHAQTSMMGGMYAGLKGAAQAAAAPKKDSGSEDGNRYNNLG